MSNENTQEKIDELEQKISKLSERFISERNQFLEEGARFREYLEKLLYRMIWAISILVALALGIFYFYIGRTSEQGKEYINDQFNAKLEAIIAHIDQRMIDYRMDEVLKKRLEEVAKTIINEDYIKSKAEGAIKTMVEKKVKKLIPEISKNQLEKDAKLIIPNYSKTEVNKKVNELIPKISELQVKKYAESIIPTAVKLQLKEELEKIEFLGKKKRMPLYSWHQAKADGFALIVSNSVTIQMFVNTDKNEDGAFIVKATKKMSNMAIVRKGEYYFAKVPGTTNWAKQGDLSLY